MNVVEALTACPDQLHREAATINENESIVNYLDDLQRRIRRIQDGYINGASLQIIEERLAPHIDSFITMLLPRIGSIRRNNELERRRLQRGLPNLVDIILGCPPVVETPPPQLSIQPTPLPDARPYQLPDAYIPAMDEATQELLLEDIRRNMQRQAWHTFDPNDILGTLYNTHADTTTDTGTTLTDAQITTATNTTEPTNE